MLTVSNTAKKLILSTMFFAAILAIIGSFFVTDKIPFFLGAMATMATSALKIILMERSIAHSSEMDVKGAVNYARAQYAMRYFLTLGVTFGIAMISVNAMYGAIAALFGMPLASYTMRHLTKDGD